MVIVNNNVDYSWCCDVLEPGCLRTVVGAATTRGDERKHQQLYKGVISVLKDPQHRCLPVMGSTVHPHLGHTCPEPGHRAGAGKRTVARGDE